MKARTQKRPPRQLTQDTLALREYVDEGGVPFENVTEPD